MLYPTPTKAGVEYHLYPCSSTTAIFVYWEVGCDDRQKRSMKSLSSLSVTEGQGAPIEHHSFAFFLFTWVCMVDDKWHQHSFKCLSPLFSLQSEKGAGRQGIGRYRSGNESVFFFSFPLVFVLSGCVTYVWRSDHTSHASVQLLCYVVICLNAFIFVLLLFNSKLSLKPSWKKKEKSIHLKKLKLKQ